MVSTTFLNQLNRLDKTLFIKLDRLIQRYIIYRKDRQNVPREILVIENDGDFCYPNYNHIAKLYSMDMWQNPDMVRKMDEWNENLDKESDEKIHRISDEVSKVATRTRFY